MMQEKKGPLAVQNTSGQEQGVYSDTKIVSHNSNAVKPSKDDLLLEYFVGIYTESKENTGLILEHWRAMHQYLLNGFEDDTGYQWAICKSLFMTMWEYDTNYRRELDAIRAKHEAWLVFKANARLDADTLAFIALEEKAQANKQGRVA